MGVTERADGLEGRGPVTDLMMACSGDGERDQQVVIFSQEFLRLHNACIAANPENGTKFGRPTQADAADYESLSLEREAALARVRGVRTRALAGFLAKRSVLKALTDWLGFEDPFIGEFASELVEESALLLQEGLHS